ncbi:MAG: hypothetical protein ABIH46_00325 [Chloroflexota bacterium]
MNREQIEKKLEVLADVEEARDSVRAQRDKLIDEAIPDEVKAKIEKIKAQFADRIAVAETNAVSLAIDVKAAVASLGESVKSKRRHAVYSKGRVSWNSKGLDGYAVAHPEINSFRSEGEPSVSIREVK